MEEKVTADMIRKALQDRYQEDEWYLGFEVGDSCGMRLSRHANAVAINAYPSRGFACEYAGQSEYSLCIYTEICNGGCPLIWGGERNICFEEDAIFTQWEYASKNSHRTRKRLALQIANLPVREGVKCI